MEIEIDLEKREANINQILHIANIENKVFKKFDDDGCMYVNYEYGRLYRRNNIFYHINYNEDHIYMFDENMEPLKDEYSFPSEWCHDCQQFYDPDHNSRKYYRISYLMDSDKSLYELFRENAYSPRYI